MPRWAKNEEGKYSMLNRQGFLTSGFIYDALKKETTNLNADGDFIVAKEGKIGIVNTDNEILLKIEYEEILDAMFDGGYQKGEFPKVARLKKEGKYGYYDKDKKILIEPYKKLILFLLVCQMYQMLNQFYWVEMGSFILPKKIL